MLKNKYNNLIGGCVFYSKSGLFQVTFNKKNSLYNHVFCYVTANYIYNEATEAHLSNDNHLRLPGIARFNRLNARRPDFLVDKISAKCL